MGEEHVGKKRRKEVRQAITMSDELRKILLLIVCVTILACVIIAVLFLIAFTGVVELPSFVSNTVPLIILVVFMIFVAPKVNKYWTLRDAYKAHLERYNISKADMNALKDNQL